jgi:thioredoxin 1
MKSLNPVKLNNVDHTKLRAKDIKKRVLGLLSLTILGMVLVLPGRANAVTEVTAKKLKEEIKNSDIPILVDFWTPWCGPCRMIAPSIDEIANQYQDQIKVVKVNVDENPSVDAQYGIRTIPTLIIFKDGKRMEKVVGAVSKTKLEKILEKYLQPLSP